MRKLYLCHHIDNGSLLPNTGGFGYILRCRTSIKIITCSSISSLSSKWDLARRFDAIEVLGQLLVVGRNIHSVGKRM